MYHATFVSTLYKTFFNKQIIWIIIGLLLFIISHFINYNKLFKYSFYLYISGIILLVLTLLFGSCINGSKAWLDLKFFSIETSEYMKLVYTLYLANLLSKKRPTKLKNELLLLLKIFIIFLIPSILIFKEPDTGAIIFLFIITMVLLYNSKLSKKYFISILFIIILSFLLFIYFYINYQDKLIDILGTSIFYRIDRIINFKNGMQYERAHIALGSAPIYRFNLDKALIYIPESATDFIFSLIPNVFGIIGNYFILFIYFILLLTLYNYISQINIRPYRLFSYAFFSALSFNILINISMNIGLFPIIGIPLPFLSYGGSSMITNFLFLSIIFSKKKKPKLHL